MKWFKIILILIFSTANKWWVNYQLRKLNITPITYKDIINELQKIKGE